MTKSRCRTRPNRYNIDRDGFELTGSKPSRKIHSSSHPRAASSHIKKEKIKKDFEADHGEKVKQEEGESKKKIKKEVKQEVKIKTEIKKEEKIKKEIKEEDASDEEGKKSGEECEDESSQDSEGEESAFGQSSASRRHATRYNQGNTYNSNFFGDG